MYNWFEVEVIGYVRGFEKGTKLYIRKEAFGYRIYNLVSTFLVQERELKGQVKSKRDKNNKVKYVDEELGLELTYEINRKNVM